MDKITIRRSAHETADAGSFNGHAVRGAHGDLASVVVDPIARAHVRADDLPVGVGVQIKSSM